ncbi:MAG: hypothetical protein DMD35_19125 [Gemmatimonadetes bacterium]|nr:MAG: hypothetical protein DMD35_19125 [Gemmatimonadota bacterium]
MAHPDRGATRSTLDGRSMTDHDLARLLPVDRFGDVRSVKSFPHGLSGAAVYDVATDAGDFVVRVLGATDDDLWHRQITMLRLVADAAIAPPLAWVDEGARTVVSVKIAGPLPTALVDPAARPRAIASVVETLARLHRLPSAGVSPADPTSMARGLWLRQSVKPGFPAWALPAAEQIDRAATMLDDDPRRVPSHNDMNPTNVLWDGTRVWLVDWDASGLTHPYPPLRRRRGTLAPREAGRRDDHRRAGGDFPGTAATWRDPLRDDVSVAGRRRRLRRAAASRRRTDAPAVLCDALHGRTPHADGSSDVRRRDAARRNRLTSAAT